MSPSGGNRLCCVEVRNSENLLNPNMTRLIIMSK